MWKYSETLMDHFMNPRNVGSLDDPDGHSEVGSPQCGDAMFLDIRVDDQGRISEIAFKTFGCAGAIASASALTEMAKGLTLEEALKIRNSQIADYLGGMPPEKFHCSVMGHQALKEAAEDYRKKVEEIRSVLLEEGIGFISIGASSVRLQNTQEVSPVQSVLRERLHREIKVEA
jgi:NifU-like protein involved in Fe-S cluster formation